MGAEIKKKFGLKVDYIESGGGRFEVVADGKLLFSKKAVGRFPEHAEIFNKLKQKL